MKKKGFLRNTFIMFAAMFITKGLGAVLKIPLGNILGGEGMGYFTTAYSIFTPVLAFACSGIPTVVTQTVAQLSAQSRYREIFRFRKSALLLGGTVGLAGTALILIVSVPFAYYAANSPAALPAILLIAPAVFGCSVTAVLRGYYEGLSDMLPTALSQVIEAAVKAAVGVGLSYFVYIEGAKFFGSEEKALPYAAAAAILGVTISEFCGTIFITAKARRDTADERRIYGKLPFSEAVSIARGIFLRALPLALGAAAASLISFADLLTISNCINLSRSFFPEAFASAPTLSGIGKELSDPGNFLYGCYSGMVMSVYALTAAAAGVIARCSLPRLACAAETDNKNDLASCLRLMLKGTAMISFPVSMMTAVLAGPVLTLLYPVRAAEVSVSVLPLQILGIGGIISSFDGAMYTAFNALGDFKTPVKITLYSGAVKFLLNAVLLTIPQLNIAGAALSSVLSGLFGTVISYRLLKKRLGIPIPVFSASFAPFLAGTVSSLCLLVTYNAAFGKMSLLLCVIFSLAVSVFLYIFVLFAAAPRELSEVLRIIRGKKTQRTCKSAENVVK